MCQRDECPRAARRPTAGAPGAKPHPHRDQGGFAAPLGAEPREHDRQIGAGRCSGADVWTGWRSLGNGRWTRDWPFDWGTPKAGGRVSGGPIISQCAVRRELISVDGRRLAQMLREQDLRPGTFRVDEAANQIVVAAEGNADLNASLVEVGVRSRLFYVWNRDQITLRGLVFTHAVDRFDEQAVAFQVGQGKGCSNITIDNVRIVGNGQGGFESFCDNVNIRNSVVSDNGYAGLFCAFASGGRLQRLVHRWPEHHARRVPAARDHDERQCRDGPRRGPFADGQLLALRRQHAGRLGAGARRSRSFHAHPDLGQQHLVCRAAETVSHHGHGRWLRRGVRLRRMAGGDGAGQGLEVRQGRCGLQSVVRVRSPPPVFDEDGKTSICRS
jgi:hypothetical protein